METIAYIICAVFVIIIAVWGLGQVFFEKSISDYLKKASKEVQEDKEIELAKQKKIKEDKI